MGIRSKNEPWQGRRELQERRMQHLCKAAAAEAEVAHLPEVRFLSYLRPFDLYAI
jgi:hypothetical protein